MKKLDSRKFLIVFSIILLFAATATARRKRPTVKPTIKPLSIVFAVINDGQTLEPIGTIDKGALEATATRRL